jgi:hypothetical protein
MADQYLLCHAGDTANSGAPISWHRFEAAASVANSLSVAAQPGRIRIMQQQQRSFCVISLFCCG